MGLHERAACDRAPAPGRGQDARPRRAEAAVPSRVVLGSGSQFTGGLSPSSVRRTQRPPTSATRAGSRCARAAAMRRTGHACSRATTSWPWASAAATCSRSAVSAACWMGTSAGRGWGRAPAGALTAALPPSAAALHAEPYIMFSTDKKSLLCIRCFRDMQGWVEGAGGEGAGGWPGAGLIRGLPVGRAGLTAWTSSRRIKKLGPKKLSNVSKAHSPVSGGAGSESAGRLQRATPLTSLLCCLCRPYPAFPLLNGSISAGLPHRLQAPRQQVLYLFLLLGVPPTPRLAFVRNLTGMSRPEDSSRRKPLSPSGSGWEPTIC